MSARDLFLVLLVAGSWSGVWVVGKVGVSLVPPVGLSAVRFLLAGALLLGLSRATGASVARERWLALLALAATGILGYNALGGALTLLGVRVATVREGEGAWLRRFAGI